MVALMLFRTKSEKSDRRLKRTATPAAIEANPKAKAKKRNLFSFCIYISKFVHKNANFKALNHNKSLKELLSREEITEYRRNAAADARNKKQGRNLPYWTIYIAWFCK
jgi:hypothetical protein